mmetsp:Transcript_28401/g.69213  ORF Transcript_28401/g.69213 Transcript_28401/m.69213 type:complete len:238 (+) Transcript_28401:438-1151(+)
MAFKPSFAESCRRRVSHIYAHILLALSAYLYCSKFLAPSKCLSYLLSISRTERFHRKSDLVLVLLLQFDLSSCCHHSVPNAPFPLRRLILFGLLTGFLTFLQFVLLIQHLFHFLKCRSKIKQQLHEIRWWHLLRVFAIEFHHFVHSGNCIFQLPRKVVNLFFGRFVKFGHNGTKPIRTIRFCRFRSISYLVDHPDILGHRCFQVWNVDSRGLLEHPELINELSGVWLILPQCDNKEL